MEKGKLLYFKNEIMLEHFYFCTPYHAKSSANVTVTLLLNPCKSNLFLHEFKVEIKLEWNEVRWCFIGSLNAIAFFGSYMGVSF